MHFGLSLILHPATSFKKGKVPIVKQMLPVMVRSVCAKYSVEHLRHFKHKIAELAPLGDTPGLTQMAAAGHGRFTKTDLPRKNSGFTVAIHKFFSLKLC